MRDSRRCGVVGNGETELGQTRALTSSGPCKRSETGPSSGSMVISEVQKRQHCRSSAMSSRILGTHGSKNRSGRLARSKAAELTERIARMERMRTAVAKSMD